MALVLRDSWHGYVDGIQSESVHSTLGSPDEPHPKLQHSIVDLCCGNNDEYEMKTNETIDQTRGQGRIDLRFLDSMPR